MERDVSDPIEAIQSAIINYKRWINDAPKNGSSPATVHLWQKRLSGLEEAVSEINRWRAWSRPLPAKYGDLSDLPPELLAQLSGTKTDELEDQIYAIVKAGEDQVELDIIMIELFRRHGEVYERRFLTNKLYRMAGKGFIYQVPGRKGVYSVHDQGQAKADEERKPAGEPHRGPEEKKPKRESFIDDLDDEIPF